METLKAGSDVFLVCEKEENVWRAYEAVYKYAERNSTFARMVGTKAKRVVGFKARSPEVNSRMSPPPRAKKVDLLRRRVWEFTEDVRLGSVAASSVDAPLTEGGEAAEEFTE